MIRHSTFAASVIVIVLQPTVALQSQLADDTLTRSFSAVAIPNLTMPAPERVLHDRNAASIGKMHGFPPNTRFSH